MTTTANGDVPFDLVRARLNLGHTTRSAAEEIGVARMTLEAAERGAGLHPASAKKIADFYGVLVTDLPTFHGRLAS